MLLTDQERQRFIAWCAREVESNEKLIQQAKAAGLPVAGAVAWRLSKINSACKLVCDILKNGEQQTLTT